MIELRGGFAVDQKRAVLPKDPVAGAKVLTATILDLLTSPELLQRVKAQFREDTKDTTYFTLLPADAKPPLDMNREMMERVRPAMRKYYLNKTPKFE